MIRAGTLFILGAGASAEVGLPLGKRLIDKIANDLNFYFDAGHLNSGDGSFYQILRNQFKDNHAINEHVAVAARLPNGLTFANSIDQYLDTHTGDEKLKLCGKAAIANEILKAESDSPLTDNRSAGDPDLEQVRESWYQSFAELLFEGSVAMNLILSSITSLLFVSTMIAA